MNQTKKTILLAALFALILVGAAVSYKYLSKDYTPPSDAVVLPTPEQNKAETEVPAESVSETASETSDMTKRLRKAPLRKPNRPSHLLPTSPYKTPTAIG